MPYVDDFSKQAREYARYRPQYPDELFQYLASLAPGSDLAVDCGTGSGQAAVGLAPYFAAVIGTDASQKQIENAQQHPNVSYRVANSEATGIESGTVDLVTSAQAMHWFDLEPFYDEVKRILKPGGVLAAWCYYMLEVEPALDSLFSRFFHDIVGPYWSPGARLVMERYRTIPFPFVEVQPPQFEIAVEWDRDELVGYFMSWSGRQRFMEVRGYDPLDDIHDELHAAWPDPQERKLVRWPLDFRIGRPA